MTKIAAIADIHVRKTDKDKWETYFKEVSAYADVLLICGDLTHTGDESEATILAGELKFCTVPVICVLGNHDYDKGQQKLIRRAIEGPGVHVLDGETMIIGNIGFAGIKGFGGGFGDNMLSMFGESAVKIFVQETINEAALLARALNKLDASPIVHHKIVLMHYSPLRATVVGEPEAIFPFLGSSRLVGPMISNRVTACFHGHAHNGTLEGNINSEIKVFNVSKPVLVKAGYTCPYYLFELQG